MIEKLAATKHLAVVSDFDGTLAGFANDIYAVHAEPRSLAALERLPQLPETTVAAHSGRHMEGLKRVFPLREPVLLGGSHGAESSWQDSSLSPEAQAHLDRKEAEIRELMERFPGAEIEIKPFQRVFHLRRLELSDPELAAEAYAACRALDPAGFPMTAGKSVIEFSATQATKGSWVSELRERVGATATVFLGDDVTDEDGFAVLNQPPDLGVKVGEGETLAAHRVPDIAAVSDFLEELAAARAVHLGA